MGYPGSWSELSVARRVVLTAVVAGLAAVAIWLGNRPDPATPGPQVEELILLADADGSAVTPGMLQRTAALMRERARLLGLTGVTVTPTAAGIRLRTPAALRAVARQALFTRASPALFTGRQLEPAQPRPPAPRAPLDRVLFQQLEDGRSYHLAHGRPALDADEIREFGRASADDGEIILLAPTRAGAAALAALTRDVSRGGAVEVALALDDQLMVPPVEVAVPVGDILELGTVAGEASHLDALFAQLATGPLPVSLSPAP